ncbi:hypothetical protein DPMN_079341 [Dreissena polymorpha]|uniref:Uncharacterized protein n=1 Tax=Dreissena polymorpha TaxID=45954 RepID=A0A9D3YSX7_DREPO|nr:hypothetical protein DPMN_079341 [Dreissena polymorpha]
MADHDVHTGEYDAIGDDTGSRLKTNRALSPFPGATCSTDDGYLRPVTAKLLRDKSFQLKVMGKPLSQTSFT